MASAVSDAVAPAAPELSELPSVSDLKELNLKLQSSVFSAELEPVKGRLINRGVTGGVLGFVVGRLYVTLTSDNSLAPRVAAILANIIQNLRFSADKIYNIYKLFRNFFVGNLKGIHPLIPAATLLFSAASTYAATANSYPVIYAAAQNGLSVLWGYASFGVLDLLTILSMESVLSELFDLSTMGIGKIAEMCGKLDSMPHMVQRARLRSQLKVCVDKMRYHFRQCSTEERAELTHELNKLGEGASFAQKLAVYRKVFEDQTGKTLNEDLRFIDFLKYGLNGIAQVAFIYFLWEYNKQLKPTEGKTFLGKDGIMPAFWGGFFRGLYFMGLIPSQIFELSQDIYHRAGGCFYKFVEIVTTTIFGFVGGYSYDGALDSVIAAYRVKREESLSVAKTSSTVCASGINAQPMMTFGSELGEGICRIMERYGYDAEHGMDRVLQRLVNKPLATLLAVLNNSQALSLEELQDVLEICTGEISPILASVPADFHGGRTVEDPSAKGQQSIEMSDMSAQGDSAAGLLDESTSVMSKDRFGVFNNHTAFADILRANMSEIPEGAKGWCRYLLGQEDSFVPPEVMTSQSPSPILVQ